MHRAGRGPLVLGTLAAAAGAAFLVDVGALPGMASLNMASYLAGLGLGWGAHRLARQPIGAVVLFAFATLLLVLTLSLGEAVDGVRRWLALGPVTLQPALVLAPLLLALAAGREGRHWRSAMLVPLALIAFQPDGATAAAMAGGIALAMAEASARARKGWSSRRLFVALGALAIAAAALVIAGIQTPPPVAFVEGTAQLATLSGAMGVGLHLVAILLALAAFLSAESAPGAALAGYIAIAALAAVFWAFPMPIAGAGPSHLIGFGLAIGWLTVEERGRARAARGLTPRGRQSRRRPSPSPRPSPSRSRSR